MTQVSYNTVPLTKYSMGFRDVAERLFHLASESLGSKHARRVKGSYSFLATSSQETAAKLVIFENGKGKSLRGRLPLVHDGVYVLVRTNGAAGRRIWSDTIPEEIPWLFDRLNPQKTIGVAPKHDERFAYFPVMAGEDLMEIAALLRACASV